MAPPGRRRGALSPMTTILGLLFLFSSTASAASAVLGIDLGTEYLKAALVKPGIPLEIVLTKDSKRKELAAVAFKPAKAGAMLPAGSFPERFYGSDAVALAARFPGEVYPNLKQLLGLELEGGESVVKTYNERYPALQTAATEGRKTVSFKSGVFAPGEESFSVEELLAMELKNVKENAKLLAGKGTEVREVVFTVPPFFTVDERRALEVAARLADLKVLGMITDGLAVGINYATGRTFPVVNDEKKPAKPETHLVFDMGAGSASATILKFQGRTVKDVGKRNKTIQEVQVLGSSWDRTLGGDALNTLIVNDMIAAFVELPGAKSASITADKVKSHGRAAAKLWKDAEKVRQVLSANSATTSFFESFYEDVDFRYKISRTKFEELAADYAARVDAPIKEALAGAGLTIKDIDSVIVHGGASRTPFVQSRLEALVGKAKIKTNVNSDEAAVFGAAFKAAGLSPSFRVKEIRDSDIQGHTLGMQYTFNLKDRDQKIFTPVSKIGSTKDLPFQMMGDFEFDIYQARVGDKGEVTKAPVLHFKSGNLTSAVTKLIDGSGCDRETFNNFVQVRLSPITGLPEITSAWVTCETEVEEAKGGVMEGVKNLFGMGGKKDQEPLKDAESSSDSSSASSSSSSSSAAAEASDDAKAGEKKKKEVRSAITFDVTKLGYKKHLKKDFKKMQDRLSAFDASDKSRRTREEVLNTLEAFTYRARDLLEDEGFMAASTAAQRTAIDEALSAASDWIYSEGHSATEKVLNAKLKSIKELVDPVTKRKEEALKRPDAIKEYESALADSVRLVDMVKDSIEKADTASSKSVEEASKSSASAAAAASESATPSADPLDDLEDGEKLSASPSTTTDAPFPTDLSVYTEQDLKSLEETKEAAEKWFKESKEKQDKLQASEDPVFTIKELKERTKKLNDVVMDLMMRKMRAYNSQQQKPKPKPKPKTKKVPKDKKAKKADKDKKADKSGDEKEQKEPTQEELDDALEKAGLKGKGIKFAQGVKFEDEIMGKDGRPLTKLDIPEDASEEDILEAIERATGGVREKKDGHDEL
ncbi:heat shock protein 70-like protein-like protein [Amniculicola lignicola CBS 123094]|uniref:Heat shock protein 70-like protein-like protein n=1 Tax=Amniculicola lignicola CBS 123094 TaxID=1392246 RepID=A0A6A5W1I8_9PLEO|nr:heat shock protein 70-like protein-like protein [Amniculicola lignicola CBS 123094]